VSRRLSFKAVRGERSQGAVGGWVSRKGALEGKGMLCAVAFVVMERVGERERPRGRVQKGAGLPLTEAPRQKRARAVLRRNATELSSRQENRGAIKSYAARVLGKRATATEPPLRYRHVVREK